MSVKKFMSSPVVTVEMDDNLKEISEIFGHTKFHHLIVVENKKIYGVISDRDLFKSLSPNIGTPTEKPSDTATLNKKAHQIMSRKPICINADSPIKEAITIFQNNDISCIPVVDESGAPVGILSWRDILRAIKLNTKQH